MAQQSLAEAEEEHTEEHVPRRSVDSDHAADASSIGSAPASDNHYKRGMAGLVAMRTHLANVMSAVDASRSNAKVARLKREVVETGNGEKESVLIKWLITCQTGNIGRVFIFWNGYVGNKLIHPNMP